MPYPGHTSAAPTIASLYRARNPLAQYPEFQELRTAIGEVQKGSIDALRMEEESHAAVRVMARQMRMMHKAMGMLTDIVVDELTAAREQQAKADRRAAALAERVAQLEEQQSGYNAWAGALRDDLRDLRAALEKELAGEGQALRRVAARQARGLEGLEERQRALEEEFQSRLTEVERAREATRRELVAAAERAIQAARASKADLRAELERMQDKCRQVERQVLDVRGVLKARRGLLD
ncbi:unnamed protein product [Pedinophyceae sp. YPF-701]|nr:unnamed protein product [Pedinophyceae sp. YPF-701]